MEEDRKELISEHVIQSCGESLKYVLRRPGGPRIHAAPQLLITVGA
ncbi:MAG: hypothetical protein K0R28_5566, partial [Paenibacillus sp.]|nr:hypothetical protein [Paenibacillus sp.]